MAAPGEDAAGLVRRLHAEIAAIVNDADMRNFCTPRAPSRRCSVPDEFRDYIKADIAKWAKVIKAAGIRIE